MTKSNEMTPEQKVKWAILEQAVEEGCITLDGPVDEESVDTFFSDHNDQYELQDFMFEFREGQVETKIPCQGSRHYESKSVAAKMPDGSWVGWTYWYGGGKHGEPESIDWMDEAYNLDCVEEQKLVTVQTFTKVK